MRKKEKEKRIRIRILRAQWHAKRAERCRAAGLLNARKETELVTLRRACTVQQDYAAAMRAVTDAENGVYAAQSDVNTAFQAEARAYRQFRTAGGKMEY